MREGDCGWLFGVASQTNQIRFRLTEYLQSSSTGRYKNVMMTLHFIISPMRMGSSAGIEMYNLVVPMLGRTRWFKSYWEIGAFASFKTKGCGRRITLDEDEFLQFIAIRRHGYQDRI